MAKQNKCKPQFLLEVVGRVSTTSPARLIESRSKLSKQLSELQNLKNTGILTGSEYDTEKEMIMDSFEAAKGQCSIIS